MAVETDFLVIGSGIGGLWSALQAARHGRVVLITKKENAESNTNYAQGGIAGVMDPQDRLELHVEDTLTAGAGLCKRERVELLVREGPDRIRDLMAVGTRFSTEPGPDGRPRLALGREGGHSMRRIVHAKDLTGREIERALLAAVESAQHIEVYENHLCLDLLVRDGECLGAVALDRQTRAVKSYSARATILAAGGLGRIYRHTTNPPIATGDGVAIVWRAGARIADMEFVQFHPTTLYDPGADSFLISEAVRGEGGVLKLRDGRTFMENYHPMQNLAPRDVVARAIHAEMQRTGDPCVLLDVTHVDAAEVRDRFPTIYGRCLEFGIDMTRQPIPIVPAAHYSCGGAVSDERGRTNVARLYVCGEVACTGVHGANRLASNSLLEAIVFAERAAADAAGLSPLRAQALPDVATGGSAAPDLERLKALSQELRNVLWEHVGIVRTDAGLETAATVLERIASEAEWLYARDRPVGVGVELRNMATAALLVVRCARQRQESRGLHYNLDHPGLSPLGPMDSELPGRGAA